MSKSKIDRATKPRALAKRGSSDWAHNNLRQLRHGFRQRESDFSNFLEQLDRVIDENAWLVFPPEQPYGSFDAMVADVLGMTREKFLNTLGAHRREVENRIPPLLTQGGDRKSDEYQGSSITLKRGTSRAYTIARLKRDGPVEVLTELQAGRISAAEARRRAPWGKQAARCYLAATQEPEAAAEKLRASFGDEWCAAMARSVLAEVEPGR